MDVEFSSLSKNAQSVPNPSSDVVARNSPGGILAISPGILRFAALDIER